MPADEPRAPGATQHGFTTVELLIVMAIAGVLAVIAIPSFRETLNNTRMNSALGLLVSDLNQARGEAIKRNKRMLVCVRNAGGTNCGSTATNTTDWRPGWVVCMEGAAVNECAASTADVPNPVLVRPPLDASLALTGSAAQVRFSPNSTSGAAATLTLDGTWADAPTRTVSVAVTGNISK